MHNILYNQSGKEVGSVELPENIFNVPWNGDLVHQVVVSMQANARTNIAHTKNRGEVRGGGKKPWKQKGTGRARHGSIRSPIWRGGGVTFGPRNDKNYTKKTNRKMRVSALFSVLSRKLQEGEILFLDTLNFAAPKAKEAKEVLNNLSKIKGFEPLALKRRNAALISLGSKSITAQKSFRNFGTIAVDDVRNLNPVDILGYKYLIITDPRTSVGVLESKIARRT